jgi:phosphate-selective porin OprO and OprP
MALMAGAAAGALLFQAQPGRAETIRQLELQINQFQGQIQNLQNEVQELKAKQADENEAARREAARAAAKAAHGPHVVETKGHEFGLESADGQNSIYLTGRVHFDVGGYFGYRRKTANAPLTLTDGENFRRARIGVVGKFMGDWDYGLIYDFGGSSDALSSAASGIENAYVVYKGFADHRQPFPVSIVLGAIDVPWTLGENIGSNDTMFMERASPQVIATSMGGGDNRTAFGATSNNDRYFLGAFLTGPTTGALHTYGGSGATCTYGGVTVSIDECNGPQMAFLARGSYLILRNAQGSLQLGVDFGDEFRPRNAANNAAITLGDFPELRVDPTKLLGTPAMPATNGTVIGGEAAAAWENAFLMGEYFHYSIDRIGAPSVDFNGGYVDASYSFGGRRHYKAGAGGYTGVIPDAPLSWSEGGWGAVELAARYSIVDLNDLGVTTPIGGGEQQTYTIGMNYYPNDNLRFMLDLEHVDVSVPAGFSGKGASFDEIGFRTQVNW